MAALATLGKIFRGSSTANYAQFAEPDPPLDFRPKKAQEATMDQLAEDLRTTFLDSQFKKDEAEDNPEPGAALISDPGGHNHIIPYSGTAPLDFLAQDLQKLSAANYVQFQKEVEQLFARRKTIPISYLTRAIFLWSSRRGK